MFGRARSVTAPTPLVSEGALSEPHRQERVSAETGGSPNDTNARSSWARLVSGTTSLMQSMVSKSLSQQPSSNRPDASGSLVTQNSRPQLSSSPLPAPEQPGRPGASSVSPRRFFHSLFQKFRASQPVTAHETPAGQRQKDIPQSAPIPPRRHVHGQRTVETRHVTEPKQVQPHTPRRATSSPSLVSPTKPLAKAHTTPVAAARIDSEAVSNLAPDESSENREGGTVKESRRPYVTTSLTDLCQRKEVQEECPGSSPGAAPEEVKNAASKNARITSTIASVAAATAATAANVANIEPWKKFGNLFLTASSKLLTMPFLNLSSSSAVEEENIFLSHCVYDDFLDKLNQPAASEYLEAMNEYFFSSVYLVLLVSASGPSAGC